jgi:hypothetical protein
MTFNGQMATDHYRCDSLALMIRGARQSHRPGPRGLAERLFNQPPQSRIANTTIMVIEFRKRSGQSSGIVGGARQTADSS